MTPGTGKITIDGGGQKASKAPPEHGDPSLTNTPRMAQPASSFAGDMQQKVNQQYGPNPQGQLESMAARPVARPMFSNKMMGAIPPGMYNNMMNTLNPFMEQVGNILTEQNQTRQNEQMFQATLQNAQARTNLFRQYLARGMSEQEASARVDAEMPMIQNDMTRQIAETGSWINPNYVERPAGPVQPAIPTSGYVPPGQANGRPGSIPNQTGQPIGDPLNPNPNALAPPPTSSQTMVNDARARADARRRAAGQAPPTQVGSQFVNVNPQQPQQVDPGGSPGGTGPQTESRQIGQQAAPQGIYSRPISPVRSNRLPSYY